MLSPVEGEKQQYFKNEEPGRCHAISLSEVLDLDVAEHNSNPVNKSSVLQK